MNITLQVTRHNGVDVIDSREVAEMIGKNHKELLRDIRNYAGIIENSVERNFALNDFFIESQYKDGIGRTLPCYLLTKKGCDMVANKMTGEKGVLFTAAYVTAFEKMRDSLSSPAPLTPAEQLLAQASLLVEQEKRLAAVEQKQRQMGSAVKSAFETLAAPAADRDQWQEEMNRKIRQMCLENGLNYQTTIGEMYRELEETAGVNLTTRQKRLRERMKRGGAKYAECAGVSKLLVVSQDKKLREIYSGIVRARAAGLIAARSF